MTTAIQTDEGATGNLNYIGTLMDGYKDNSLAPDQFSLMGVVKENGASWLAGEIPYAGTLLGPIQDIFEAYSDSLIAAAASNGTAAALAADGLTHQPYP